ncbi:MAG: Asp-tRNA(Asn)/Glu-tRNA(Gln) amidotransferase subunit GatC [Patescibacteria group bacterium]
MASLINKKTIQHLAELARIELNDREQEKLVKDLQKILGYFKELEALDTKNIPMMTGGMDLKNAFRDDTASENTNQGAGKEVFPETHEGFLKIPAIFDRNE